MKRILLLSIVFTLPLVLFAGPYNIAPYAKVKASTELNNNYWSGNVTDAIIGVDGVGEWASQGKVDYWGQIVYPWIELKWDSAQWVNKIVLYDRVNEFDHSAGVTITGSDGFNISVQGVANDGSARVVEFAERKLSWLRIAVRDGEGKDLGFSEIEVFPSAKGYSDLISYVDPHIETIPTRFFYFITGNQPYGMIGAAPITRNKNQGGGGYNYNGSNILGFGQLHCWMQSGINIMPTTGAIDPRAGMMGWKSKYSHDGEQVQPGYHRLFLQTHKIWVEQTATERTSFYRYRFTEDAQAGIVVSLGGKLGNAVMKDCKVRKVSQTEIEGSFVSCDRLWGGPQNAPIFFVMRVDVPFESITGWDNDKLLSSISSIEAADGGVMLNYKVKAGEMLQLKTSVSFTSIANARMNMDSDCVSWSFDDVRANSQKEWNEWLGKINVMGGADNQRIKFYTDMWHALLGRHKINDANGDYPDLTKGDIHKDGYRHIFKSTAQFQVKTLPCHSDGKPKYNMYNSDALWLTMWNLNTLWGLAYPDVLDDFSASLIQYDTNGGLLPRGPAMGGYSYIMAGCPATSLITSAYERGITHKWDAETGYQAMRRNHMQGGMQSFEVKDKVDFYVKNGYVPDRAGFTIQWSFEDWALAEMAKKMGKGKDAKYFAKRAVGWRNLYNKEIGLVMPKDEAGKWTDDNPLSGKGFVESTSWQASFGVSHDLPALARMMGGCDSLSARLNRAFELSRASSFRNGYVNYANQPGLSSAHVFSHAGKPWLTQYWVRRVGTQIFGGTTPLTGYGGMDEDQGQMGAISALMSIGLFSINGGSDSSPYYEITSPVFDEVRIALDANYYEGKEFVIKAYDNSSDNCYIQKALLNGKVHNSYKISHSDYARGGILELWMGSKPNEHWGNELLN